MVVYSGGRQVCAGVAGVTDWGKLTSFRVRRSHCTCTVCTVAYRNATWYGMSGRLSDTQLSAVRLILVPAMYEMFVR